MKQTVRDKLRVEAAKLKRFTALGLARTAGIDLSTAEDFCKGLESDPQFEKYLRFDCSDCNGYLNSFPASRELPDEVSCDACGAILKIENLNGRILFIHKDRERSDSSSAVLFPPEEVLGSINQPPTRIFLEKPESFLWHISDLHFRTTWRPFPYGPGHCSKLLKKFLSLLEQRGERLQNDILVVSGDCTDDGDKKSIAAFETFIESISKLGIKKENILLIPGNHDAWNGQFRGSIFLSSYAKVKPEKRLLDRFRSYPKRELPSTFEVFTDTPIKSESRLLNGLSIEFILINTSVPNEMARGVFPECAPLGSKEADIRIAVMHHHLIENPSVVNLDADYVMNVKAMRVLNHGHALNFLFNGEVDISLHGHKHTHYIQPQRRLRPKDLELTMVAAPSLLEKSYDLKSGNELSPEFIGFNVMIPTNSRVDVFSYRLADGDYILRDYQLVTL